MIITGPRLRGEDGCRYEVDVQFRDGRRQTLWFAATGVGAVAATTDAALLGLLIRAMADGEDIHVAGPVTGRLARRIALDYQLLLRAMYPAWQVVDVTWEEEVDGVARPDGVALGFSGGTDSLDALLERYLGDGSAGRPPLTHLVYANAGSHGPDGQWLFRQRFERVAPIGDEVGLPFITVDSNLDEFYRSGPWYTQTSVVSLAAVAHLLAPEVGTYLLASAAFRDSVTPSRVSDMGDAAPFLLDMLDGIALHVECVGTDRRRVDKVARISDLDLARRYLDVCMRAHGAGNCSACRKCLRTMLTLECLGRLDDFAGVFDLDTYRRWRTRYIANLLGSRYPYDREVVGLMRDRGVRAPALAWVLMPRYEAQSRLWRRPFG